MNLIIAIDDNLGIGYNGNLLYHISSDLKYFKKLTTGKIVVMGKGTYQSLPKKPLPNRVNIVLSSSSCPQEDVIVCKNKEELFNKLHEYNTEDVFVIGGASIYKMLLPYCAIAYVTKIHEKTTADTFFEDFDSLKNWALLNTSDTFQENNINFEFSVYKNLHPTPLPLPKSIENQNNKCL